MIGLIFDILIPRFRTSDFCLEGNDAEGYDAVCEYTSRDIGERFDKIASISYFQLFGFVLFPKVHQDSIRAFTREDVLK